jgi:hypothetical protein
VITVLSCLSCSGSEELNSVQGKVLHNDQPVKGVLVTFHPKGDYDLKAVLPTGLTKDDGTFTLTTGGKAGAPAGEYVVTFFCSEEVMPKGGKKAISTAPPETRDRFQGAYAEKSSSKFVVKIKNGFNQLEPFHLK